MQFIQRQQTLSLYRGLLRAAGQLEDAKQREEARRHIRMEFEQWRRVEDKDTVKLLLTQGRQSLRELQSSIAMSK